MPTRRTTLQMGLALATFGTVAGRIGVAHAADDAIRWSVVLDLTGGPLAANGQREYEGWKSYVDWLNARGGIRGRKVTMLVSDGQQRVDIGVAGWKKEMAAGKVDFAFGGGTAWIRAISPENNERFKVLTGGSSYASDLIDAGKYPYNMVAGPTYTDMFVIMLNYMKANPRSAKPKVAFIHSDSEFGRDPIVNGRAAAERLGIEVALVSETKAAAMDVTPDVIRLREAAPDYTIFHGYAGNIWPEIIKLSRDYGIGTQFMGTLWGMDPLLVKSVGAAADGYMGVMPYTMTTDGATGPVLRAIDTYLRRQNPDFDGRIPIGFMQSWMAGLIVTKASEMAIDAGQTLAGENLVAQLAKLRDWDTGGMIGVKVAFDQHRIPVGRLYQYRAKAGAPGGLDFQPVSDWISVT